MSGALNETEGFLRLILKYCLVKVHRMSISNRNDCKKGGRQKLFNFCIKTDLKINKTSILTRRKGVQKTSSTLLSVRDCERVV